MSSRSPSVFADWKHLKMKITSMQYSHNVHIVFSTDTVHIRVSLITNMIYNMWDGHHLFVNCTHYNRPIVGMAFFNTGVFPIQNGKHDVNAKLKLWKMYWIIMHSSKIILAHCYSSKYSQCCVNIGLTFDVYWPYCSQSSLASSTRLSLSYGSDGLVKCHVSEHIVGELYQIIPSK